VTELYPTALDFNKKAKLIETLLSNEYTFTKDMSPYECAELYAKRQAIVLHRGWSWMSIEELEDQRRKTLGKLPY